MSPRAALYSGVVTAGLVLMVVWIFELPLERAAVLAPVIVFATAAVVGLVLLWTKAALATLRGRR